MELKRCIVTESRWKRKWRSLISPEAVPILLPSSDKKSTACYYYYHHIAIIVWTWLNNCDDFINYAIEQYQNFSKECCGRHTEQFYHVLAIVASHVGV